MKRIILLILASLFLFSCGQGGGVDYKLEERRQTLKTSIRSANSLVNIYNRHVDVNNRLARVVSEMDDEGDSLFVVQPRLDLGIDTVSFFKRIDNAKGKKLTEIEEEVIELVTEIVEKTDSVNAIIL